MPVQNGCLKLNNSVELTKLIGLRKKINQNIIN